MLQAFRDLFKIIKKDPTISPEIPVVRSLALRTFKWILLAEMLAVVQFYPIKGFTDEINTSDPDVQKLIGITVLMTVLFVASIAVNRYRGNARSDTEYRVWRGWWGFGHRSELRLSSDWHKQHGTGEKDSLVAKNIMKFEVMVDEFMFETLPATTRIAIAVILLFFVNWQYGLVALGTVIVFACVLWRNEKIVVPHRKKQQQGFKRLERFGTEMTNNWSTIKSLGLEEDFADKNDQMLLDFITEQQTRARLYTRLEAQQFQVSNVSRAVFYGLVIWQFANGGVPLGTVVLGTLIMERAMYISFQRYSNFQKTMNEGVEAMRELIGIMTLEPTVRQAENPVYPKDFTPSVVFDNVSFAYPDEPENPKLSNFSLKIPAYSTTALTGASGGGKSTVANLLLREYDPTNGHILIDDVDLRELDYHRFRREAVSVVSQTIQLFDESILENIRMGLSTATDEECIKAAKAAHAHEFIAQLKNGYVTMIGENGIRLSGGQRQRLAIARALVRQPLILVLDEATSALDSESQAIIQQTLDELTASRKMTIFIIAHRLSTIKGADQVVVMEGGEMVECGTHEELERLNGVYARLRSMESDGLLG